MIGQSRREGISPRLENLVRSRSVEGLILLSLPADEQMRSLPPGTDVGEALVALVLGPFHLIRDHSAKPEGELFALLKEIEALIEAQPEGFRTEDSMRESEPWEQLRVLARRAVEQIGVDRRVPQLDFPWEAGQ